MVGEDSQRVSRREWGPAPGLPPTFGGLLRRHRRLAGLSQAALAELAGLGERAIQRLEADRNRPYRATVEQLAAALNLTADERAELFAAVPSAGRETAGPAPPAAEPPIPRLRLVRSDGAAEKGPDARSSTPPALDTRAFRVPRGRLIGRESDAQTLRDTLLRPDAGLVTLTGPGGSGKTRLAIQVATELADQFEDGVAFVNLALVTDPAAVPTAIVKARDLMELGDHAPRDRLTRHLRDRHMLLLDNFEHVLAARPVVADLLGTCPRLTVLVTSREVFRIYGEREMLLPPLDRPPDEHALTLDTAALFPAVELFVERAQEVRADFRLTAENVGAVVAICRQLDGLPLAIELAAARSRLLSPQAMLARLEHRLALLTDGPRDRPARQQTLRGAIKWSYDLLEEEERQVFRQLAVFYVALARETGDRYLLESALPKWVHVAIARGVPEQAEGYVQEALGLFRAFNDGWWTARCLNLLTVMAAERGDHLRAARLLGAAEHLLHLSGARLVPTDEARSARMSAMLGAQLGEERFEAARAEGRTATLEQVIQYAMDTAAEQLELTGATPPQ